MARDVARDVDSRETLLAEANSAAARQQAEQFRSSMDLCDTELAAPSAEVVGCVYYIHGGGMASLSCYDGMYRGWGRSSRPTASPS
jgi:acetyl esterase